MQRRPVNASRLRSVGHDANNELLEVEFANGEIWQYAKVQAETFRRLMAAPNPGSFFDDKIAEEYPGRRVEATPAAASGAPDALKRLFGD